MATVLPYRHSPLVTRGLETIALEHLISKKKSHLFLYS